MCSRDSSLSLRVSFHDNVLVGVRNLDARLFKLALSLFINIPLEAVGGHRIPAPGTDTQGNARCPKLDDRAPECLDYVRVRACDVKEDFSSAIDVGVVAIPIGTAPMIRASTLVRFTVV
jgi:hypothetical protein